HGSRITVALDSAGGGYRTRYTALAVGCGSCHGPRGRHLQLGQDPRRGGGEGGMTALGAIPEDSSLGEGWQRHAVKDQRSPGWVAGRPLDAYYSLRTPQLGDEPHFPDGRVRTFAYQEAHLYSDCYVNGGMTCTSCHDPHSQGYRDVTG